MRRTLIVMFASLLLIGSLSARVRSTEPAAYEQLKGLAWQIGDWVTDYEASADSGPIKKGDLVTVHFSLRWSPDRSFMVNNSSCEVAGKTVATALEVISWDHENARIAHSYYGTWGTGRGEWTVDGDGAELIWTIQGPEGEFAGTARIKRGDESWTWQIVGQSHNGEAMADMPLTSFRRKEGEPAGDLWNAWLAAAVGTWDGQGTISEDFGSLPISAGDKFTMRFSLQSALDGRAAVGESEFRLVDKPFAASCRVLAGWDPDTRQIRFSAVWSGGLVEEIIVNKQQGSAFVGTYTTKLPGRPKSRSRIRMDFPDGEHYTIKFLDGPHKGELLNSFTRVNSP